MQCFFYLKSFIKMWWLIALIWHENPWIHRIYHWLVTTWTQIPRDDDLITWYILTLRGENDCLKAPLHNEVTCSRLCDTESCYGYIDCVLPVLAKEKVYFCMRKPLKWNRSYQPAWHCIWSANADFQPVIGFFHGPGSAHFSLTVPSQTVMTYVSTTASQQGITTLVRNTLLPLSALAAGLTTANPWRCPLRLNSCMSVLETKEEAVCTFAGPVFTVRYQSYLTVCWMLSVLTTNFSCCCCLESKAFRWRNHRDALTLKKLK